MADDNPFLKYAPAPLAGGADDSDNPFAKYVTEGKAEEPGLVMRLAGDVGLHPEDLATPIIDSAKAVWADAKQSAADRNKPLKGMADDFKGVADIAGLGMNVLGGEAWNAFASKPVGRLVSEIPSYKPGKDGKLTETPRAERQKWAEDTFNLDAMVLPLVHGAPKLSGLLEGVKPDPLFADPGGQFSFGGKPKAAENPFTKYAPPPETPQEAPGAAPGAEGQPGAETPPTPEPEPAAGPRVNKPFTIDGESNPFAQYAEPPVAEGHEVPPAGEPLSPHMIWKPEGDYHRPVEVLSESATTPEGRKMTQVRDIDGQKRFVPTDELAASTANRGKGAPDYVSRDVLPDEHLEHLDTSLSDLGHRLAKTLGLTVRQGRYAGAKRAAGIFKIKPQVIRLQSVGTLDTLAHEAGHHLDFSKLPTLDKMRARWADAFGVIADAYYGGGGLFPPNHPLRPIEGFAEFFRLYMTHPAELERVGGAELVKAFEEALGADRPEALALLKDIQAHHEALMSAPSAAIVASHIADSAPPSTMTKLVDALETTGGGKVTAKGIMQFGRQWADELYGGLTDKFHSWKVAVDELMKTHERLGGARFGQEVFQDPYKILRMSPGARNRGHMWIRHGIPDYDGIDPATPSLADAIALALAPHEHTAEWVAAKAEIDEAFAAEQAERQAAMGSNGGPAMEIDPTLAPDYSELPAAPSGKWDKNRYKFFSAYMHARNMRAQWARFRRGERELPPDGRMYGSAEDRPYLQTIETLERENPHWAHAADLVHRWAQGLWKHRHEAGFITHEQYIAGLLQHPDYVPANRVMRNPGDDLLGGAHEPSGMTRGGGGTGKNAGGVHQQRGSAREVVDPLWALGQQAYELSMLEARNDAIRALTIIAKKIDGHGAIIEKVPAHKMKAMSVDILEALKNAAKERGLSERDEIELEQAVEMLTDIFGEDVRAKIYRPTESTENGENFVYHWIRGEQEMWQLPSNRLGRQMINAIANMNRPARNLFVNLMSQPARLLRAGVTLHPKFMLANIEGDQLTVGTIEKGYVPYWDWLKGIREELRPAKEAHATRRYNAAMGAVGGMQSAAERTVMTRRSMQGLIHQGIDLREIAHGDLSSLHGLDPREWPEKLAAASELSETGSRVGLFMKREKQALDRGLSPKHAAWEGSFRARDTLDFDRRGGWAGIGSFMRMVPFLNANVQGADKMRRVAFDPALMRFLLSGGKLKPKTPQEAEAIKLGVWAWAAMLGMAALSAIHRANIGDSPEYKAVADYLRSTHWVFKGPGHQVWVHKKPFEAGVLSDIAERSYEGFVLHDPKAADHAMSDAMQLLIPNVIAPGVLEVAMQVASNHDRDGQPIVPLNLQGVDPKYQENEYTSPVAKLIGHMFGWSPIKVDYVMRSSTGHWGQEALTSLTRMAGAPMDDNLANMFTISRFVKQVTAGNHTSKVFWNAISDRNEAKLTFEMLEKRAWLSSDPKQTAEVLKYVHTLNPSEKGWVLVNAFGHGVEKEISPLQHAQKEYEIIGGLAHDLSQGDVLDHPHGKAIRLTPRQRRDAVEELKYLNMVQVHNALIDSGDPEYAHAKRMERAPSLEKLQGISPALVHQLSQRYSAMGLPSVQVSRALWNGLRDRYEKMSDEQLRQNITRRGRTGRAAYGRALRELTNPE